MAQTTIADIRAKYPQYDRLSDRELADKLHAKFYAQMDKADFYGRVGLSESAKPLPSAAGDGADTQGFADPLLEAMRQPIPAPLADSQAAAGPAAGGPPPAVTPPGRVPQPQAMAQPGTRTEAAPRIDQARPPSPPPTPRDLDRILFGMMGGSSPETEAWARREIARQEAERGNGQNADPLLQAMAPAPQQQPSPGTVNKPGTVLSRTAKATGQALRNVPENLLTGWYGMKLAKSELGQEVNPTDIAAQMQGATELAAVEEQMAAMKAVMDKGPREAAALQDQYLALSQRRGQLRSLYGAAAETIASEAAQLSRFEAAGEAARKKIGDLEKSKVKVDAEPGSPEYYVSAAIASSAEMAPALAASAIMRNPAPAMIFMGGYSGGTSYVQGREHGLSPHDARGYATLYAAAEGIPEALPVHVLLKPGQKLLTRIIAGAAAEGAQEMITEALQIGIDKGYVTPDMTWAEARSRIADAGIIGTLAGGALGTAVGGFDAVLNVRNRDRREKDDAVGQRPSPAVATASPPAKPPTPPADPLVAAMGGEAAPARPAAPAPAPVEKPAERPVEREEEAEPDEAPQYEILDEVETVDGETRPTGRKVRVDLTTGEASVVDATEAAGTAPASAPAATRDQPESQPQSKPDQALVGAQPEPAAGGARPAPQRRFLTHEETLSIETDPQTFQYKGGADTEGVTTALQGVTRFDPNRAGQVVLFETRDGRLIVADGHQRTGLARRMAAAGQEDVGGMAAVIYREADGYTPEEVMRLAAIKNIGEGSGSAVDAARVLRSSAETVEDLGLPPQSALVRTAEGLRRLSDEAFGMVVNGRASERDGAIVGRVVANRDAQIGILGLLARLKPANAFQAESIARQAAAEVTTETQSSLFGDEEVAANLYLERAKILDNAVKRLADEKRHFGTLTERIEAITAAGNVLAKDENARRVDLAARMRDYLASQANLKGPISDALSQAARDLKAGTTVATATGRFLESLQRAMEVGGGRGEAAPGGRSVDQGEGRREEPQRQEVSPPEDDLLAAMGVKPDPATRPEPKPEPAPQDGDDLLAAMGARPARNPETDRRAADETRVRGSQSKIRTGAPQKDAGPLFDTQGDIEKAAARPTGHDLIMRGRAILTPFERDGDEAFDRAAGKDLTGSSRGRALADELAGAASLKERTDIAVRWVTEHGKNTGLEHAVILDADGVPLAIMSGHKTGVSFHSAVWRAGAAGKIAVSVHNHPSSGGPSAGDFAVLALWPKHRMVIAGHNGDRHEITATEAFDKAAMMDDAKPAYSMLPTREELEPVFEAIRVKLNTRAWEIAKERSQADGGEAAFHKAMRPAFALAMERAGMIRYTDTAGWLRSMQAEGFDFEAIHGQISGTLADRLGRAGFDVSKVGDRGGDQATGSGADAAPSRTDRTDRKPAPDGERGDRGGRVPPPDEVAPDDFDAALDAVFGKPEPKGDSFDTEAFDKSRAARIAASKAEGNTHLDQVEPAVETMRGKAIYYVHDPKVRGVIRTVSNSKDVVVHWSDDYSAEKEMAVEKTYGKKRVMESWLAPSDLKDYVLGTPGAEKKAKPALSPWRVERYDNAQDPSEEWRVARNKGDNRHDVWGYYATKDEAESARAYAAKRAPASENAQPRPASDIAKDLGDLFGETDAGFREGEIDEGKYARAVPLFREALAGVDMAAMPRKDVFVAMIRPLAAAGLKREAVAKMRPYFDRFLRDLDDGTITLDQEASNAPGTGGDLERDRGDAGTQDRLGKADVPAAGRGDGTGAGTRGATPDGRGKLEPGGERVSPDDAAPVGTGRDQGIQGDGRPGQQPADDRDGAAGRDDGEPRVPDDDSPAGVTRTVARNSPDLRDRVAAQKAADEIARRGIRLADEANIRETLPLLLPEQQDDVVKIERRFLKPDGHGMLITNGTGTGKAQPLDAAILTPQGWRRMGDLVSGDLVISADGKPAAILSVHPQGEKPIYRVEFSDGAVTECCDEHLWETQTLYERRKARENPTWACALPKVRALSEIRATLDAQHFVPVAPAIEHPARDLPVRPYTMGVILGDGCLRGCGITVSSQDEALAVDIAEDMGESFDIRRLRDNRCPTWRISDIEQVRGPDGRMTRHRVADALRAMGLMGADSARKFIPADYLISSIEDRTHLLQGLLDTDGTVDRRTGSVSFCTVSGDLADGVVALVRSLGGIATRTKARKFYTHNGESREGQLAHIVTMHLPNEISPFRLKRKAALVRPKKHAPRRKIVAVSAVGMKPAQCIAVDHPRHLYVTDDYILTHNTYSGGGVIKRFAKAGKTDILVLAPSQGILDHWIDALHDLGLSATKLESTTDAGRGIVLTTYANAGVNTALARRKWDLVVSDEAHKLSQNAAGDATDALNTLRAITNRPADLWRKSDMLHADEWAKMRAMKDGEAKTAEAHRLFKQRSAEVEAMAKEPRSKVLFLSATPFAYDRNIDYGEGYLFDYPADGHVGHSRQSGQNLFMVANFGYRIRYHKLTRPDANVDSGVFEREFHEKLRREGMLSGRHLDIEPDYERRFILRDDAQGAQIDGILDFIRQEAYGKGPDKDAYTALLTSVNRQFNHLRRMQLLEAIKARLAQADIDKHLALGRKVVIFHDYNVGGGFNPFRPADAAAAEGYVKLIAARPEVEDLNFTGYLPPVQEIKRAYGDRAVIYNGTVPQKERAKAKAAFNKDGSGVDIMIVQSAAGEAGISLHDVTGGHQRVLVNLGMPTRPTTALQEEGRIRREGSVSDALFHYYTIGTTWERQAFARKIAERSGTVENLALGNEARTIRDSFIEAYENAAPWEPGEADGKGGKARDRAIAKASPYEIAKTHYFGRMKTAGRRDQREGIDFYPTPEPLAFKMVEWAGIRPYERVLEPSAGDGSIARYFPEHSDRTIVEPSSDLLSRAELRAVGARAVGSTFEAYHIVNKHHVVVMNPPFGMGGKTAMEHLAKAARHLRPGGRIVALIPTGPAADKRFDAWWDSDDSMGLVRAAEVALPAVTFEKAGTAIAAKVVILDKIPSPSDRDAQREMTGGTKHINMTGADTIGALFDRLEGISVPDRPAPARDAGDEILDEAEQANPEMARPAPIAAPLHGPEQNFTTAETTHGKTGEKLWVATATKRVDDAAWKATVAVAKRHGGWFSSFRGRGAIPGYQFKSEADRQAFLDDMKKPTVGFEQPTAPFRQPISLDRAIIGGDLGTLSSHPDYEAAKAGDVAAAVRVAQNLVTDELAQQVRDMIGDSEPIIVPVASIEATGRNKIPPISAVVLADRLGLKATSDIVQSNAPKRTALSGLDRIFASPAFDGPVTAGQDYLLLDDTLTQGGTFAALASHIQSGGGNVVGAVALTGKQYSAILRPSPETLSALREKHGDLENDFRAATGYGFDALTESEARYLTNFKPADAVRDRILAERDKGRDGDGEANDPDLGGFEESEDQFQPQPAEAIAAMMPRLRAELDRLDLKRVRLFHDETNMLDLPEGTQGMFLRNPHGGMAIVVAASLDPMKTIHHEVIHALRSMNLFTPEEWRALEIKAARSWVKQFDIVERYPSLLPSEQIEEAIAEAFAEAAATKKAPAGSLLVRAFNKIARFLKAMGNVLRGAGFNTVEDVFGRVLAGQLSRRNAGNTGAMAAFHEEARFQAARVPSRQARAHMASALGGTPHIPDRRIWEELTRAGRPIWARLREGLGAANDAVDKARIRLQDRFLPVLRAQQAVMRATGAPLPADHDAYIAETTFSGKVGRHLFEIDEDYTKPIIARIAATKGGLTVDAVGEWLTARHAIERNARIASINPKMPDGGSGMMTADAQAILAAAAAGPHAQTLDEIGDLIDKLRERTLKLREDAGLITHQEANLWRTQYRHYVPLKGFAETDLAEAVLDLTGTGRRFNVRGPESKRALGRRSEAFNPLQAAITQAQEVSIRAERNRVGQAIYNLAKDFPSPALWSVKTVKMKRFYNRTTGLVESRPEDPVSLFLDPNEMAVKVGGEEKRVIFHDPRLARAAGSVGADQMGWFVSMMSIAARYFSSINTMLDPEFVIRNAFRDMTAAQINIRNFGEADRNAIAKAMIRDWPKAFVGAFRGMGNKADSTWTRLYREFEQSGAKVSFWRLEQPEAGKADLDKRIRMAGGSRMGPASRFVRFSTRDNPVLGFIERTNLAVDNAIRLAAYVEARKRGWDKGQAAALAKNLTVNFNRRGEWGATINALYPFANASIQGTQILFRAMTSKRMAKYAIGMVALGIIMDAVNAGLSHEDDDGELAYDKIQDWKNRTNLAVMLGPDAEEAASIWLPYGYSLFPYLGQQIGKVARGVKKPETAMADFAAAIFLAFSPITGEDFQSTLTPTMLDPINEMAMNQDWLGRPIRPENAYADFGPNAYKYYAGVSDASKQIADAMNRATGGTIAERGWLDVSPEYIDHMFGFATGGAGRTVGRAVDLVAKSVTGNFEEIELRDVPVARSLVYATGDWLDRDRYYRFRDQVKEAHASAKAYQEAGKPVPKHIARIDALYSDMLAAEKVLRAIKKQGGGDQAKVFLAFNKRYLRVAGRQGE